MVWCVYLLIVIGIAFEENVWCTCRKECARFDGHSRMGGMCENREKIKKNLESHGVLETARFVYIPTCRRPVQPQQYSRRSSRLQCSDECTGAGEEVYRGTYLLKRRLYTRINKLCNLLAWDNREPVTAVRHLYRSVYTAVLRYGSNNIMVPTAR